MAGELKFALMLDDAGNAPAVLQRTAQAFQSVNNSAAQSDGALARNAAAQRVSGQAVAGTRAGLQALNSTLMIFGGSVAPQATAAAMALTGGLATVRAGALAAGVSLAAMAAPIAGLLVSLYALTEAWKSFTEMREAKGQAGKSEYDRLAQLEAQRQKLLEISRLAEGNGAISGKEMSDFNHRFNDSKSADMRDQVVREWSRRLAASGLIPLSADKIASTEAYSNTLRMFGAKAQGGDAAQREQIYQDAGRQLKEALKLATDSGKPFEPLRDAIMRSRDAALADLDKVADNPSYDDYSNSTKELREPRTSEFTSIEKMGGNLSGLGLGFANDYARSTADNTRRMLEQQRETNRLLANNNTGVIVNE